LIAWPDPNATCSGVSAPGGWMPQFHQCGSYRCGAFSFSAGAGIETRQDEGVDQAWGELAKKRFAELTSGEVESVFWEDIKKKVKG